jgi:uncharacterized protein (TIGR02001 family)
MTLSKSKITLACALLAGASAFAQTAKAPEPDWTVAGNVSMNTDYRFRGFTQTNYGPALQGGIDLTHKSGLYLGNWNSNVKDTLYNGASLEMDLYGGFKGELAKGLGYDIGAIYYMYPKSGNGNATALSGATASLTTKITNTEVYFGLSYGPVSGKLYYATGDYFKTAKVWGAANSTKGTTYLDLSYSTEAAGLLLGAHVGVLTLKNHDQAALTQTTDVGGARLPKSVSDYKLSVGKDIGSGYVLTAAAVSTSKKGFMGTDMLATKAAGRSAVVLSLAKTF